MSLYPLGVNVFCSYVQNDEKWLKQLEAHLSGLKRQGLISLWHNQQILASSNWAEVIDTHLEVASVILLLISADFIASDYCYGIEMKRAIERHEANAARVIPIVVRPCDWQHLPLAALQILPLGADPISTWTSVDEAWTQVASGIRRVIEDLSFLSVTTPRTSLPPIWMIPHPRNYFFLGRDAVLLQIHTQLQTGQTQAISGLGGVGKTQIAIEYAYRYYQEYEAVLWVYADSKNTLISSYNTIAYQLNLQEQEQEIIIQAVKVWLQTHRKWLLILDNANDLTCVSTFLPPVLGGHVLLTTQGQAMGHLAQRVEAEMFSVEEGALFLLRRSTLIASNASFGQALIQDRQSAMKITQELGGLPLALDQAGAYLEETGCSLEEYLQIYQQYRGDLFTERRGVVSDHPASVTATLSLSFQRVEEQNPTASNLLRFCAYLSSDAIPEEIFTKSAPRLGPLLEPLAANSFLLSRSIEVLRAYSLLKRDPQAHTISIHRLVQEVLKDLMDEQDRSRWAERVVRVTSVAFPFVEHQTWLQCNLLLSHALVCKTWIELYQISSSEAIGLLNRTGIYLCEHARYQEAEPVLRLALSMSEQRLGTHPFDDITSSLNHLANLYRLQGKYAEAEPLFKRALESCEQALEPQQSTIELSLNNLAVLYMNQGKYGQAELLFKRALEISTKVYKSECPFKETSWRNLAELYRLQGKFKQAEPLLKNILEISEHLGINHPDTAFSLNNLAMLYIGQGKYEQAEPMYRRALEIHEQQLGVEHPNTATSLNNLAMLYEEQGKYEQAEPLLKRALEIHEQHLGIEHSDTALSLNNLATSYLRQGKYIEAEPLLKRALEINEQVLGPQHPNTASALNNLALLYQEQKKYKQAEAFVKRALEICEQILGPQHPNTAGSLYNLAVLYAIQKKYEQAEPLSKRVVEICEQVLGPQHPNTMRATTNYTLLLQALHQDKQVSRQKPLAGRKFNVNAKKNKHSKRRKHK